MTETTATTADLTDAREQYRPAANAFQHNGLGWLMARLDSTTVRMSEDMATIRANAQAGAESIALGYVDLASMLAGLRQWKRADAIWLAPERQQVWMSALEADLRKRGLVGRCTIVASCPEDRATVGWTDECEHAYLDAQQD